MTPLDHNQCFFNHMDHQDLHCRLYHLTACALMTALLCALSPITVSVGPVPFSFSIFVICLASYLLGPVYSVMCVAAYLLLGIAGLPVFSGWTGGPARLAGPTGGFLVGYLPAAFLSGLPAANSKSRRSSFFSAFAMAAGVLSAYALGTAWFMLSTGAPAAYALSVCVLPFIPADAAKIAAAILFGNAVRGALARAGLLPC